MSAEVPDRFRHLDARHGLIPVSHRTMHEASLAVKRSLPTMDHAVRLIDEVTAQLGDRAWRDPEGGERVRRVLVRDAEHAEWIVPFALVEQQHGPAPEAEPTPPQPKPPKPATKETSSAAAWPVPVDAPEGWTWDDLPFRADDARPEILPAGPTMRPGQVTLGEGPASCTLHYDARGWRRGLSQSAYDQFTHLRYYGVKPYMIDPTGRPTTPLPHSLLCRADLDAAGHTLAAFARMVCESKIAESVAVRVRAPAALPGGPLGCWQRAQAALREILWKGELPEAAQWILVDGYEAIARGFAGSLDAALAAWRDEVERVEPLPPGANKIAALPPPPAPPMPEEEIPEAGEYEDPDGRFKVFSTGIMTMNFEPPPRDPNEPPPLEWPSPGVETTPAVAIPLPPPPALPDAYRAAGFTRVVRLVGGYGHVHHGFLRQEGEGFTLVGEGVADIIDPATVAAEIDAVDEADRAFLASVPPHLRARWDAWSMPFRFVTYGCWDGGHQKRVPLQKGGGQFGGALSAGSLDGDVVRWQVLRLSRS